MAGTTTTNRTDFMIVTQNTLSKPEVLTVPDFESTFDMFKRTLISLMEAENPEMANQVAETLENDAELSTKLVQACTRVLITLTREINEDALQMFAAWADGVNLDAKVADFGLKRQVLQKGDPTAYPPVPEVMESDEHLRQRYFLAPYSFSHAGPELAYKYHALTLDEQPRITVSTPNAREVLVRYQYELGSFAGAIKDATAEHASPGHVHLTVLAREGNGQVSDALINAVTEYFHREDMKPLTDTLHVKKAEIIPYEIKATIYINPGPDTSIIHQKASKLLASYTAAQHRLGASIQRSMLDWVFHDAGAIQIKIHSPSETLETTRTQAPYCTKIDINVETL